MTVEKFSRVIPGVSAESGGAGGSTQQVVAFYRFTALSQARLLELQSQLRRRAESLQLLGTVLLAPEGINGGLAGEASRLTELVEWLRGEPEMGPLCARYSAAGESAVYYRLRIKIKAEIVSFGVDVDPTERTGEHVDAQRFNALLADPRVVVIDTRNDYEVGIGTFPGAINPSTDSFREFPDWVEANLDPNQQPQVAMFCTGGIRCEKASAYMLERGFKEVFQLDGGVLNYLETVADDANQWQGDCFVFDQRVTLTSRLEPGEHAQCHACRRPLSAADRAQTSYVVGVSCPHCIGQSSKRRAAYAERQKQIELAAQRGVAHLGPKAQPSGRPSTEESEASSG